MKVANLRVVFFLCWPWRDSRRIARMPRHQPCLVLSCLRCPQACVVYFPSLSFSSTERRRPAPIALPTTGAAAPRWSPRRTRRAPRLLHPRIPSALPCAMAVAEPAEPRPPEPTGGSTSPRTPVAPPEPAAGCLVPRRASRRPSPSRAGVSTPCRCCVAAAVPPWHAPRVDAVTAPSSVAAPEPPAPPHASRRRVDSHGRAFPGSSTPLPPPSAMVFVVLCSWKEKAR